MIHVENPSCASFYMTIGTIVGILLYILVDRLVDNDKGKTQ